MGCEYPGLNWDGMWLGDGPARALENAWRNRGFDARLKVRAHFPVGS